MVVLRVGAVSCEQGTPVGMICFDRGPPEHAGLNTLLFSLCRRSRFVATMEEDWLWMVSPFSRLDYLIVLGGVPRE